MQKRIVTNYFVRSPKLTKRFVFAIASDLHNAEYRDLLPMLHSVDAILVPGDLANRYKQRWEKGVSFVREAASIAPVYFSTGNHDRRLEGGYPLFLEKLQEAGGIVLDGKTQCFDDEVILGGLASQEDKEHLNATVVEDLRTQEGFRLLLCHHPEYYERWIRNHDIDLTISGHAHGGQVVLFGQGIYSPGQGLFPKLTCGFYDDEHLLVSRGLTNSAHAPRFNDPCELLILQLIPEQEAVEE